MIKEFENIRERSERAKILCLGYKTTGVSEKNNRGPKTATRQNIGAASAAPAAPLPTPIKDSLYTNVIVQDLNKKHCNILYIYLLGQNNYCCILSFTIQEKQ